MRSGPPRVSVVVETENERDAVQIGLRETLAALAAQTYPADLTEVIVVDSGEVPELPRMLGPLGPRARRVDGRGLREYEMKNAGVGAADGDIVAFTDSDCAPGPDWIAQAVRALETAAPEVVGVQGRTILREGRCSRHVSVLLYGTRTEASGRVDRVVSDNCAFRRDFLVQTPFEAATLPTTPETVLLLRAARRSLTVVRNYAMLSTHDYPRTDGPGGWAAMLRFLLPRAYSNGYCMTRVRRLVPELRASWTLRLGPAGPLVLTAGKLVADLRQIADNRRTYGLTWGDWIAFAPVYLAYCVSHLVGGCAAWSGIAPPRA